MANVYPDTSALIKLYVEEEGAEPDRALTPGELIAKWRASERKERFAAQGHFIDLRSGLPRATGCDASSPSRGSPNESSCNWVPPRRWLSSGHRREIDSRHSRATAEVAYGIRINASWRLCFRFADGNAYDAEIVDYH